jgi:RNA 2',3'-cyclic 3'-phosphodiesterase
MRLFVAVAVPAAVGERVMQAAAALNVREAANVRWGDPASWHLTVAFLGNVDPSLIEPLAACLRQVASQFEPFTVQLRPSAGRGARSSVLWIELEPSEPLAAVAAAVRSGLRELGLPARLRDEDRAFRPHLTLARARGRTCIPRSLADAYKGPAATWTVPGLELMRSHLNRAGARYETLLTAPFQT